MGGVLDELIVAAFTEPLDVHLFGKVLNLKCDPAVWTDHQCPMKAVEVERFVLLLSLLRHVLIDTNNQLHEYH